MTITVADIIPFTEARHRLSDLVDDAQLGKETIITKNGKPAVALIDARRLDYYHQLERCRIHLLLLHEAENGLTDVETGRTTEARTALAALKARAQNPPLPAASLANRLARHG